MTIVLQYQFWDLTVTDEGFEVGLSFGGVPERVAVPFDTITAFFDPAVQFGFQFEVARPGGGGGEPDDDQAPAPRHARRRGRERAPSPPGPDAAPAEQAPTTKAGGGEVVRLDRFRKKLERAESALVVCK